ncbi:MAG: glutamate synthase large subunit [Candidatus Omnitrophica bacterium]|nr:glutamate synthase large subunit [Candidatus Omnitrophota bacterium]
MKYTHFPHNQGLYDSSYEKDACGVGFVCNIKGLRSNNIVREGISILRRLEHRGAVGADPKTGDGAGILMQMPHDFFVKVALASGITLGEEGSYGSGLIFLPRNEKERAFCEEIVNQAVTDYGQIVLGWRDVPVNNAEIGATARSSEPVIKQIFISRNGNLADQLAFERKLYVIRKVVENKIKNSELNQKSFFYITNFSSRTFSYKGLLTTGQVENFFLDLGDSDIKSAIALVHSRYSTNTFPTWDLAQPFRFLAHNGEINTLRGNVNWMGAKERLLSSDLFGHDIEKLKPIVVSGGSDSACLDNVFELLLLSGRSLAHTMMTLIPEAWENNSFLTEEVRAFHKYHVCVMEPWDGPASVAVTDGICVGALLDRNGLRPSRYIVTKDDRVIMASEVGVLDTPAQDILYSGRLMPGKIFLVDTKEGRIVNDDEIKEKVSTQQPYKKWVDENIVELEDLPSFPVKEKSKNILTDLKSFGYTREDLKSVIKPMAETGKEPTGSMGNDTPPAVLAKDSQLVYNYFKQLFAQVTNPAIDPIREELVMSLDCYMGGRKNLLDQSPQHCRKLHLSQPILSNQELEKLRNIQGPFKSKTISILFDAKNDKSFKKVLSEICMESEKAIDEGNSFIILSDRGVTKKQAAIPALIAVGAVHQHLVKRQCRSQIALILESAEPREVHHFALLFGFGVGCVNPYLAYEAIEYMVSEGEIDLGLKTAVSNYVKSVNKGILKILSKMGISTLQSYRGAQIFEAIGLADDVIDICFKGTSSRIGGATLSIIAQETLIRHRLAYSGSLSASKILSTGGTHTWRRDGRFHLWRPETISALQDATRENDYSKYKEFAGLINDQSENPTTLRSLLKFSFEGSVSFREKGINPIDISEVEPKEEIFKRFATGAMSFGSISRAAHETLAIAMNRIGGKSNTGEGGEDPRRFEVLPGGDSKRSAIKQVASGRFGVTTNYLVNADEIQIKVAQGAKPGEGGQLPGHKVSVTIAKTRYTTPGVTLISPPPHHDIYSIEDLAQLIFDLKNTNPKARISVKLVSEIGVGTIAAGVAKGHADMILISGADGGTGASPLSSIHHAGVPWELGLSETHQTLVLNDLRSRVRLQTDGQMRTGRDVAIAAMLGAEEFGFCTAALIVSGCVMLRHCHLNNCSVGVATQDDTLQKRFSGKPEYVVNYFNFIVQELREIMANLGVRTINELVGRTDLLNLDKTILPWKAKKIDYSKILYKPKVAKTVGVYCQKVQDHGIENVLDKQLIQLAKPALEENKPVEKELTINNTNRTVGAMLSGAICRRYGENGLSDDTIHFKFTGVAGQSFGAWLAKGVTFELEGLANDYIGKGISGGKIIVYPSKKSSYKPGENIIVGNTSFYGAITGEAYIRGIAGERFCIRNSGLSAVVEGVGDHACEYMTGGKVVVIGQTGRNFAAGMSGGIAYVWNLDGNFRKKCNLGMVQLEELKIEDKTVISDLLLSHCRCTGSNRARDILDNFDIQAKRFVKVMPIEYKKIIESKTEDEVLDLTEVSDA